MIRLPLIAVLLSLLCACSTQRKVTVPMSVKDSTNVEVRYKLVERIDTVYITLPVQTAERTTNDTTSTLETEYAKSVASILPNGLLYHNLVTKSQPVPVPVKTTSENRDSVAVREVEKPVPYPVEVEINTLTWFQKAQIYGCRVLVALLALGLIIKYRKGVLAFISRLCRLIR